MKLTPGLIHNARLFGDLSSNIGISRDGEVLDMLPKAMRNINISGISNRNVGNLTSRIGLLGEKIVQLLLPENAIHTGAQTPYDFTMPSRVNGESILLEVKTAQIRNRGVIRQSQIERYTGSIDNKNIYFSQIFYRTRNGLIPSKLELDDLENQFFPVCMYIFPVSFIVYLTNSVQTSGGNTRNQFYALTQFRAHLLYSMVDGLNLDDITEKYISRVFTTIHLSHNPNMQLYIVDHRSIPHMLGN